MAVNLISGNDTTINQTDDDIQVNFSTTRNQQITDIENNIGDLLDLETTYKSNIVGAINEVQEKATGTILWTNSNYKTAMASQTITNVDLSDYDFIEVNFMYAYNNLVTGTTGKIPIIDESTTKFELIGYFNLRIWSRQVQIEKNNNIIKFLDAARLTDYGSSIMTNNDAIIPIRIIGYKTNLFN